MQRDAVGLDVAKDQDFLGSRRGDGGGAGGRRGADEKRGAVDDALLAGLRGRAGLAGAADGHTTSAVFAAGASDGGSGAVEGGGEETWGCGGASAIGGVGRMRQRRRAEAAGAVLAYGWRRLDAVAVRDLPGAHGEAVADFDVAAAGAGAEGDVAAFGEALEGDEADAAVFVGEVGPDDVVEDVALDGVDGAGEGSETFGARGVVEGGCVDGET